MCHRFVKTIQEPGGRRVVRYSAWQEGARKDIERAFGVLQRKFHILTKHFEFWYVSTITEIVESTIILHNMMVSVRMDRGENEEANWYETILESDDDGGIGVGDPEGEAVERAEAELLLHQRLEETFVPDAEERNLHLLHLRNDREFMTLRQKCAQERWTSLYDPVEHVKLREAIMDQLETNSRLRSGLN